MSQQAQRALKLRGLPTFCEREVLILISLLAKIYVIHIFGVAEKSMGSPGKTEHFPTEFLQFVWVIEIFNGRVDCHTSDTLLIEARLMIIIVDILSLGLSYHDISSSDNIFT